MEIIIAVIIAVSGWLINHILTIRAQNKSFINHIINDARLKITRAIGDYQDWLSKIHVVIITSDSDIILQKRGININWLQKVDELIKLFGSSAFQVGEFSSFGSMHVSTLSRKYS